MIRLRIPKSRLLTVLVFTMVIIGCHQTTPKNQVVAPLENVVSTHEVETSSEKRTYGNIAEVIEDSSFSKWGELKDGGSSLGLCFWYRDTLLMAYSTECYFLFPYKKVDDKIVVYWEENIDTKYELDLVRAVRSLDKSYLGKPFMILELKNDTTLSAFYPIRNLIQILNSSSKERTFFPEQYVLAPEDFF